MRAWVLLAALAAGSGWASSVMAGDAAEAREKAEVAAPVTPAAVVAVPVVPASAPAASATAAPAPETARPAAAQSGTTAAAEPAKPVVPAKPVLLARIDLTAQRLEVSVDGAALYSWPISSGRAGYATPTGNFRAQWTSRLWHSRKYDWAPMPHAVFFNGGVAVHATQAVGMLGRPASHGCVRLAPQNAATFYALVHKYGLAQSQFEVFGQPPSSRVAERMRSDAGSDGERTSRSRRAAAGVVRRNDGRVTLPPGSPYAGRDSFTLNGVRYVRVRS